MTETERRRVIIQNQQNYKRVIIIGESLIWNRTFWERLALLRDIRKEGKQLEFGPLKGNYFIRYFHMDGWMSLLRWYSGNGRKWFFHQTGQEARESYQFASASYITQPHHSNITVNPCSISHFHK